MPTEAQYVIMPKIEHVIRFGVPDRYDVGIWFPRTEEEEAQAKRKAERRRQRRKGK